MIGRRALLAAAALPMAARAQASWPERAVRLVVPYPPGGPTDILARLLAERLAEQWKQPVTPENRPGGGSSIGAGLVASAPPDGHTLLVTASAHVMSAPLIPRLPYHPARDFTALVQAVYHPFVLVVHPSVPARSFAEFLALARREPGGITIGTAGVGNASHLAMGLLNLMAGIELTHVPFSGSAPAQTALLGGQVKGAFLNSTVAMPVIREGSVVPLATTAATRWRELPALPTIAEAGYPGYEALSWYGLLGPARMAPALVERIAGDTLGVLRQPAVRERLVGVGLDMMEVGPAGFGTALAAEADKWAEVVRRTGMAAN